MDVDIDGPEVWDFQTGSAVVVAHVDTGIDYNHEDLASNIWINPGEITGNGIDDEGNGFVDDIRGWNFVSANNEVMDDSVNEHGTATAGIIAAIGNNARGVAGVTWNARLMAIKVFDANGGAPFARIIQGIDYAMANGARISNNSYEFTVFSEDIRDAITRAHNAGSLFVAAAGNGGIDQIGDDYDVVPTFPCAFDNPNIICTAAVTRTGLRSNFSNFGLTTVDVGSPGSAIFTTLRNNRYGLGPGALGPGSGTSFAAPHVSGIAALVRAQNPGYTHLQIRENLLLAAQPPPTSIT